MNDRIDKAPDRRPRNAGSAHHRNADMDGDEVEIPRMSLSHPASVQRRASDEYTRMRAAFERVSDMPENRCDGWGDMLELRQAVEKYLARWG